MVIDILLLIFAGWGFYQGYSRGIISTFFTVFSVLFGIVAAFKLTPGAARMLETSFQLERTASFPIGFILTLVLSLFLVRMIGQFIESGLEKANINFINQTAGGILLASLYTLLFSVLLWFGTEATIVTKETSSTSMSYPYLKEFPGKMKGVYEYLKPAFKDFWQESIHFLDKLDEGKGVEETESEPNIFDLPDEDAPSDG